MSGPDERLREILSTSDAPAQDDAFVAAVMARAARAAPRRPQPMPLLLRPFAWTAWLAALAAVAPVLADGARAALATTDPQVLSGSLALVAAGWFVLDGFRRVRRPVFAT